MDVIVLLNLNTLGMSLLIRYQQYCLILRVPNFMDSGKLALLGISNFMVLIKSAYIPHLWNFEIHGSPVHSLK